MAGKRALMISPETPYPLHGGGALRTGSLLNYLARRFDVDLVVFRHLPTQNPEGVLPQGLVRDVQVVDLPAHRRELAFRMARNGWRLVRGVPPLVDRFRKFEGSFRMADRYDFAVIEHFWCAEYLERLSGICDRVVLNLHNVESVLHQTCASAEQGLAAWGHRRFGACSRRMEQKWLPRFDAVLTASEEDADRVRECGANQVIVYPNAIPMTPLPKRVEEDVIAFSGNLEYQPNRTAIQFFAREIWPTLSRANPTLKWRLIGMNPAAVQRDIQNLDRVETTGPVEDAVNELAAAKVVVAPLLSGSGTRLKIIEAWAAGRPVVATSLGAEGLGAVNGRELYIATDPREFIQRVQHLLNSCEARKKLGAAGRSNFEHHLSWDAVWKNLDASNLLLG